MEKHKLKCNNKPIQKVGDPLIFIGLSQNSAVYNLSSYVLNGSLLLI